MVKASSKSRRGRGGERSSFLRRQRVAVSSLFLIMRRLGIVLAFLVVVLVAGACFFMNDIHRYFGNDIQRSIELLTAKAGFEVENILVDGRVNSDSSEILARVGVGAGDSIFAVNPMTAQKHIESISWVKSAHVERRLPDTIYIKISEREPMALWQDEDIIKVIDAEGIMLTDQDIGRFSGLFMVRGENAPQHAQEIIQILRAQPVIWERVDNAHWVDDRRWNLNLKGGQVIKLPEEDIGLALSRLVEKHNQESILDKALTTIDVRTDRFIVQTELGKAQEFNKSAPAGGGVSR